MSLLPLILDVLGKEGRGEILRRAEAPGPGLTDCEWALELERLGPEAIRRLIVWTQIAQSPPNAVWRTITGKIVYDKMFEAAASAPSMPDESASLWPPEIGEWVKILLPKPRAERIAELENELHLQPPQSPSANEPSQARPSPTGESRERPDEFYAFAFRPRVTRDMLAGMRCACPCGWRGTALEANPQPNELVRCPACREPVEEDKAPIEQPKEIKFREFL